MRFDFVIYEFTDGVGLEQGVKFGARDVAIPILAAFFEAHIEFIPRSMKTHGANGGRCDGYPFVVSPPFHASNSRRNKSTHNVRLFQHWKLMLLEDLLGDVVVFHAQTNDGFSVGMRDERVEIIDVQFGLEQCGDEAIDFLR